MRLRACMCGFALAIGGCAHLPQKVRVEVDERSIEFEDRSGGKERELAPR
ncbi:MAG: hypothetical protein ACK4K7_09725 [Allosphingosinicella sp.]